MNDDPMRSLPVRVAVSRRIRLLAAAMSSLSSGLNSACSVITSDFFDRLSSKQKGSEESRVRLAKYVSLVIGAVVVLLGSLIGQIEGNILELCYKIGTLLVAPLFLLFFLAMFVSWATPLGTHVAILCSVAMAVGVAYFNIFGLTFQWMMPASFLTGAIVGALASLLPVGGQQNMDTV